jgi:hypothetical protein
MTHNPNTLREPAQQSALESLLNGRTELAETRLSVTAVQIIERLRIRAKNLKQLVDEELSIDNKLLKIQGQFSAGSNWEVFNQDFMGIEAQLEQRNSNVQSAQRREDVECWRDLTHVMRDFLNAWDGFSRNAAKNRFISALPQPPSPGLNSVPSVNQPAAYSTHHNDNPITSYTPNYRE